MGIDAFCQGKLQLREDKGLLRVLHSMDRENAGYIVNDGKKYVSFCCNDYFGLSHNDEIKRAAIDAIHKYSFGAGGSRLVTGNNVLYQELEDKLSKYKKRDSALIFSSGYSASIGAISALIGKGDLIVADRDVHACFIDAAHLSGARLLRFEHNKATSCEEILKKHRKEYANCLILTNHVFSMSGDVAPLADLKMLSVKYESWLMVDDAHGLGIRDMGIKPDIDMGTLSKACGGLGGYVCASSTVVKYLFNYARSMVYSTALPPCILAAAIKSIDLIDKISPRPTDLAKRFCRNIGMEEPETHIVPISFDNVDNVIYASNLLREKGFIITPMRPPTVIKPMLRVVFSSMHKVEDVDRLSEIIKTHFLS